MSKSKWHLSGTGPRKLKSAKKRSGRALHIEALERREVFAAGDLDLSFGGTGIVNLFGLGADAGLTVKTAGSSLYAGGGQGNITKLFSNGAIDTEYGGTGTSGNSNVAYKAWTLQSTGAAIYIDNTFNSTPDVRVRRLNALGTADSTFGGAGSITLDFLAAQTDGSQGCDDYAVDAEVDSSNKIWVLTYADTDTNFYHSAGIARLTANGALDTTFSGDGIMAIEAATASQQFEPKDLILSGTGAFVTGVEHDQANLATGTAVIYKIKSDGTLDTSFGTNGKATISAADTVRNTSAVKAVVAATGEIYAAFYRRVGTTGNFSLQLDLTKLNANGSIATGSFGTNGVISTIYSASDPPGKTPGPFGLGVQSDGKPILSYDEHAWKVARYTTGGQLDTDWGTNGLVTTTAINDANANPQNVTIMASGQIIVAGRTGDSPPFTITIARYVPAAASVTSKVDALPEFTYQNNPTITWSGTASGGSTITGYDVYYVIGQGSPVKWQDNVPASTTSAVFNISAARRQTVGFYSLAHDSGGGIQTYSGTPDTTTDYVGAPWQNPTNRFDVDGNGSTSSQIPDILLAIYEYKHRVVSQANGQIILPPDSGYVDGPYPDISGDNIFDITDILQAITSYRQSLNQSGESAPLAVVASTPAAVPVADSPPTATSPTATTSTETTVEASTTVPASSSSNNDDALLALLWNVDDDEN